MAEKSTRKQSAISLKVKMELLKAVDLGNSSKTDICKKYGIANSTLSTIIKNRDLLTATYERSMFEPNRKRMRFAKHENLEAALLVWFKQAKSQNVPLSVSLLMEKAYLFADQLGIKVAVNISWVERFKKRNGIVLKNITDDANQESPDMTWNWLQSVLPTVLEEYSANDVFNANETGLFYRCLPDKYLEYKVQPCLDGQKSDERITVMVACNSDGSEKLPLFVIGNCKRPRCFENVRTFPVEYAANKKAWMVANTFTDWLLSLDKYFLRENRKVTMIVDSCPAHSEVMLKAIKLVFLPPNNANILQPCDQGIIQNLKFYYRKQLLKKYLISMEAKEMFSLNLLDALHMLSTAWNLVTPNTIENCFRSAGFSRMTDLISSEDNQEAQPLFSEMFRRVSALLKIPVSLEEFVTVDDNVCTAPILTDSDILDVLQPTEAPSVSEASDDNVDHDIDSSVPLPTTSEMRKLIKSMRRYFAEHTDGEMNQMVDYMEEFVNDKLIQDCIK